MKAISAQDGELVWSDVPEPQCGPGQVKIQVHASAVNRADLLQAAGGYPPPPGASEILGLECGGEVVELGEGVQRVAVGDQVCALLAGGGYAERVVVPAGQVLPVPRGLTTLEAAAIPEVFATAFLNLYMEAQLSMQEKVLIHAGASGVGTAAIQLLQATNNPCFVTVGSADKVRQCVALGAAAGHDRHHGSFVEAVQDWAGESGVDVVLDPVGGQYLADNCAVLAVDGRLVLIGLMGGVKAEINLGLMMMKRLRLIASTLRSRPIGEKAAIMDRLQQEVWPKFEDGSIRPIIETRIKLANADEAHALVATNETIGKVILTLD